jgi:hypothetical protein
MAEVALAVAYQGVLSAVGRVPVVDAVAGLRRLGYDTTPATILDGLRSLSDDYTVWAGGYSLTVNGRWTGDLVIRTTARPSPAPRWPTRGSSTECSPGATTTATTPRVAAVPALRWIIPGATAAGPVRGAGV